MYPNKYEIEEIKYSLFLFEEVEIEFVIAGIGTLICYTDNKMFI